MTIWVPGMWPKDADILGDGPSTPRIRAISVVWAAQADTFVEVIDFRKRFLKGELLPVDEVDNWLKEQPESADTPAWWLYDLPLGRLTAVTDGSYIIPSSIIEEARNHKPNDLDKPYMNTRMLFYATPEHEHAHEVIRATDGVLDTLRTVARLLVKFHTVVRSRIRLWREEQAATYVLTGYVPLVPEEAFLLPARSGRRQTDKHLQLAAFQAQQDAIQATPAERLETWNARFPQWAYKNTTNFGWDSRQALRRLIPTNSRYGEEQQQVPSSSALEVEAAIVESNRQQGIEGDEGAVMEGEVASILTQAYAEKQQQMGGRKSAVWASEVPQLAKDAKRRNEAEKNKSKEGER